MNETKQIQLTTKQGLLMLAGIALLFGGLLYWNMARTARSYSGTVTAAGVILAPYGCHSEGNKLYVSLRPEPEPEGFREENRALIFSHNITERNTSQAIATKVEAVAWRDQGKNVSSITCSNLDDQLTTWTKRRGGRFNNRDDYWSGSVKATCEIPGFGKTNIDLELENCGF